VEADDAIRIGLRHVRGLREEAARALERERERAPFASLADCLRRTPLHAAERRALAATGAFHALGPHRRAALWQVEAAWSAEEPLLRDGDEEPDVPGALRPMSPGERLAADFTVLGLTGGAHPLARLRDQLPDVWRAADLPLGRDGETVRIAGPVICRQRPGTAKGFLFLSLEDETGIANAVVHPDLFAARRLVITQEPALRITGRLEHRAGVIHIRAERIEPLTLPGLPTQAAHSFR
jgi:error-prone DNA polymerase